MSLAAIIDVDGTWSIDDLTEGVGRISEIVSGGLPGRHHCEQVHLGDWGSAFVNQDGHFLPLAVNVEATRLVHCLTGSFFLEQLRGPVVLTGAAAGLQPLDIPMNTLARLTDVAGPAVPQPA